MKSLREALRGHYGTRSLDADRRQQLLAAIRLEQQAAAGPARPAEAEVAADAVVASRRRALAMVASLAAAALFGAFVGLPGGTGPGLASLPEEIAHHHMHLRGAEVDFRGGDAATLQAAMPRLDFELPDLLPFAQRGLEPVGARYCAIAGELGVEIRLVDARGRAATLCVARAQGLGGAEDGPVRRTLQGLAVEVWRHCGLVLGLAVPA